MVPADIAVVQRLTLPSDSRHRFIYFRLIAHLPKKAARAVQHDVRRIGGGSNQIRYQYLYVVIFTTEKGWAGIVLVTRARMPAGVFASRSNCAPNGA